MTYHHYIWEALVQLSKESGGCTNPPYGEPDCYHCQLLGLAADVEKLGIRAEAAEADLLAVRETLANVIDERDDARAEVERLRKERNNWQPIETTPEDKLVLVCKEGFGWALAHKLLGAGKPWTMYVAGQPVLLQPLLQWHPTHWMPLPAPPDAGD